MKHRSVFNYLLFACIILFSNQAIAEEAIRVACIGQKYANATGNRKYSTELQQLLGNCYKVMDFGILEANVAENKDLPYSSTTEFHSVLQSRPEIVFVDLVNDDALILPGHTGMLNNEYTTIIRSLKQLSTHPRIILLLPVASDLIERRNELIEKNIIPQIQKIAFDEKCELIDLHSIFLDRPAYYSNGMRSAEGTRVIAARLKEAILQKEGKHLDIFQAIPAATTVDSFYGYDCAHFVFEGRECKIVRPRRNTIGLPWIWRARFWNVEPQTEIALLERGFHVVYCDVAELFGNTTAISIWNHFYSFLVHAGLSHKATLEGFSRGGIYVYNWAADNPEKVVCVYADAPVLQLQSWPGGKGRGTGSPKDWEIFKNDYGLSEEGAKQFKENPIDKAAMIVKGGYPMLHVVGDSDQAVPVSENTDLFRKRVQALGGQVKVISKPGIGHHPHSLRNPSPIVEFILKATFKI